ncbi:MAG: flagellar biosynthesis protein FlhB [Lachnospiraceae bacterium]|nr:flagellar biosynthesis protein FlhB [Lachnospiraceae bacterium]
MEKEKFLFSYRLQFFAKEGPGGEKTEEPTSKKLSDARKDGQVAKSQELNNAAALLSLFLVLKIFVSYIGRKFIDSFDFAYSKIERYAKEEFNTVLAADLIQEVMVLILIICLPVFLVGVVVAIAVNILQVKWKPTTKPLQPKFSKLNPISGFKKIISMNNIMELVKAVIKIIAIFILAYSTLKEEVDKLATLYGIGSLSTAVTMIGNIVIDLGMKISMVLVIVGFADFIYQKIKFKKDMRMTKQEIKDEYKQSEGDPQIKGKIKQRMREASQRRMMQSLPEADVVITNPTHFACALKYDKEKGEAPILIAKGADHVAAKIKEVAKKHDVPIVENKPLARMLYYNVDLDTEIPSELYQMVAEVLAYVYSLKNK